MYQLGFSGCKPEKQILGDLTKRKLTAGPVMVGACGSL